MILKSGLVFGLLLLVAATIAIDSIVVDMTAGNPVPAESIQLERSDLYKYTKDNVELIKVHVKYAIFGPDCDFAVMDNITQVSDSDPSRVIKQIDGEEFVSSVQPLELHEGYELQIQIEPLADSDSELALNLTLLKDGLFVHNATLIPSFVDYGTYKDEYLRIIEQVVAYESRGMYDQSAMAIDQAVKMNPKNIFLMGNSVENNSELTELITNWNETEYLLLHTPDWITVTGYPEGRGVHIYVNVYNNEGLALRANGTLRIEIYEKDYAGVSNQYFKLWSNSYEVRGEDFLETAIGMGQFARPALIWDLGRISYDTIKPGLGDVSSEKSVTLEIRAYFETADGRTLQDKTSAYVD